MTRLTDGKKTVGITMQTWDGSEYAPDWSYDFYGAGNLNLDEKNEAYIGVNVDYCVEQAMDWQNGVGDFCDELDADIDDRAVYVEYEEDAE